MPLKVRKFNAQVRDSTSGEMIPTGLLSSDTLSAINTAKNNAVSAVTAAGTAAVANFPQTAAACDTLAGDFAATYVPGQAYAIGDYCTYQYQLYQCNGITNNDSSFNARHWELIKTTNTINDLKNELGILNYKTLNCHERKQITYITTTMIDSIHLLDFPPGIVIPRGAKYTLKIEDPDNIIRLTPAPNYYHNITIYQNYPQGKAPSSSSYTVTFGNTTERYALDDITGFIGYKGNNSQGDSMVDPPGNIIVTCTYEKTNYSDNSLEYRIDNVENEQNITKNLVNKITTTLGTNSVTVEEEALMANTFLELEDAPWFIMKNQGISARVKFDENSFTSLSIGKGHNDYHGSWITIDDTYIHIYSTMDDLNGSLEGYIEYDYMGNAEFKNQNDEQIANPDYIGAFTHGLTISDFLEIFMYETVDGKIHTNIITKTGSISLDINSLYRWNYAPFISGEQDMTDVKISYSCADLRSPLWMFGDDYLDMAADYVGKQLKNFGFTSYLIDSITGGLATDGSNNPGKSISNDLNKLLEFATPKYIVWTLGMNGDNQMNIDYITELQALCEEKDITLILYMPPSIPNNNKEGLNTYISTTGLRYIDAYAAVGANAQGEWYTGFLSDDDVHPSTLGAKVIAMRFIADVPELMQYGYSTGNVDSESDDDNET